MAEVHLTALRAAFVAVHVDNELAGGKLTGTEVALKAGYSAKNAATQSSILLQLPEIQEAIAERKRLLAERALDGGDVDAKRVIREWAEIAVGDTTEVVTVRRVNCRHCHGVDFNYQRTDAEYARETAEELQTAQSLDVEPDLSKFRGGGGYYYTRDPNPACPECCGEGVEDVHIKDLRRLTPKQRKLIAGVRQGKYGTEVLFRDQDSALRNLAQWLGLLVNKNEHAGPGGGPIPTANVNYTLPSDPMEAARQYRALMEGKTV